MTYEILIKEAKRYIEELTFYECEVARLAIACRDELQISVPEFSLDISIPRRTLSRWILIYEQILMKVDIHKPTKEDWDKGKSVQRQIEENHSSKNFSKNRLGYRDPNRYSEFNVRRVFDRMNTKKIADQRKGEAAYRMAKNLSTSIPTINLKNVNADRLRSIHKNTKKVYQTIAKHLSNMSELSE